MSEAEKGLLVLRAAAIAPEPSPAKASVAINLRLDGRGQVDVRSAVEGQILSTDVGPILRDLVAALDGSAELVMQAAVMGLPLELPLSRKETVLQGGATR